MVKGIMIMIIQYEYHLNIIGDQCGYHDEKFSEWILSFRLGCFIF